MDEREIVFSPQKIGNVPSVKAEIDKAVKGKPYRITKHFIDARHKNDIKIIYRVTFDDLVDTASEKEALPLAGSSFSSSAKRPVIVGFGPAGMFAGLVFARYGLKPLIIEKGSCVEKRSRDVASYKESGVIDPSSNIQFGEGGAGTFSDGKLYTGVCSGLKGFIAQTMVRYGAPGDIMYDAHPHVGTDNLVKVVKGIREEIISLGGEIRFDEELTGLICDGNGRITGVITDKDEISADNVILALGNSSRKFFTDYKDILMMQSKPFAVGVRIEHLRSDIDRAMYGFDTADYRNISAANYKLAVDTCTGKKLYTFCMCPGGEVVPSASFENAVVTNGMSYSTRDGVNSNCALLVPYDPKDTDCGVLTGVFFQDLLEKKAFKLAGGNAKAPMMTYGDLKRGRSGTDAGRIIPTYKPGTAPCDLRDLFPLDFVDTLREGIALMGRKIKGFDCDDAVLTAVETRSSSPVRIPRNRETFESVSLPGIYPIGEGAGYAGGIMSSAIDGIRCANAIASTYLV